jgi:hypothetical protein
MPAGPRTPDRATISVRQGRSSIGHHRSRGPEATKLWTGVGFADEYRICMSGEAGARYIQSADGGTCCVMPMQGTTPEKIHAGITVALKQMAERGHADMVQWRIFGGSTGRSYLRGCSSR